MSVSQRVGCFRIGFTPQSLLELLKRRGRSRPEDFARLDLVEPFDLPDAKSQWRSALDEAEQYIQHQPPDQIGCLYWLRSAGKFVMPLADERSSDQLVPHFGSLGGVLPRIPGVDG